MPSTPHTPDEKQAFGMFNQRQSYGPTLGTLEHHIQMDQRLDQWERDFVMRHLRSEIGPTPQGKNTPLMDILPRVGGGVLGFLIAKYFKMGALGQAISTAGGYGIGATIAGFYKAFDQATGNTSHLMRRL
jgi:hypothetical protein